MIFKIFKRRSRNEFIVLPDIPKALRATNIGFGFNFVKSGTSPDLIKAALPDCYGEKINIFPQHWKWEQIAVSCGFFDSLSEAKRAGWSGEIPDGWTERKYKRLWQVVYVLKPGGN